MLDSLSNIFKITELRNKILYTLMMFAVFRAGIHIPVPGVDASVIESLFTSGNLFGLLDLFAGGLLSFYFFAAAAVVTALAAAWAVIAAASFGFSLSSAAAEAITDSVDSAAAAN